MPTEKAAVLCLSFARFLFNGLNYQGLFTLPLRALSVSSAIRPFSLSLSFSFSGLRSCLRSTSGYLLGFYLWSQSQCSRPIWTGARSNFSIILGLFGRTKLLPVGRTTGGRRDGFRERSKALRVIRSGIIFCRVLFQFINKDS